MFIGHYAASLGLKKVEKKASLGMLFLAVQLPDILFFLFALLGVEHFHIIENYTEASHLELYYYPYTHSLLASALLAFAVYAAFRFIPQKENPHRNRRAWVMGIAVFSHWVFDLIVHIPDLPLAGDQSPKVGLGLWHNAVASYLVEGALLVAGLVIYLRSTKGRGFIGKYGMILLVIFMLGINVNNIFGPPFGNTSTAMSISALITYFVFAGVAFWLDGKRK